MAAIEGWDGSVGGWQDTILAEENKIVIYTTKLPLKEKLSLINGGINNLTMAEMIEVNTVYNMI